MFASIFMSVLRRRPPVFAGGLVPLLLLLVVAGCSRPIGAERISGRVSHQHLNRSALTSGSCSSDTGVVLHRFDLTAEFRRDPEGTLRVLHGKALTDHRRDILFALAELNFLHGERLQRSVKPGQSMQAPDYFLSASIYASLFLLGNGQEAPPGPFDRRFRIACDLYNRGVAQAFARTEGTNRVVRMEGGTRQLVGGAVEVKFSKENFKWNLDEIEAFLPADEFILHGLSVRDRQAGLGSPLIVVGKNLDPTRYARRFPATLFLRVPTEMKDWDDGRLTVVLELISTYDQRTVTVDGREIPLEGDTTAPLAYGLNDASIWKLDLAQFFSAKERIRTGVYFTQPYQPGRIPVVFVHGTASSPIWWAEMWNTLRTDSALREKCQFWYFVYNTGNPVTFSASRLREELCRKVNQLDPEGKDPALRRMVVVGHSQGGLLSKLTVTETGDRLWRAVTTNDLAALQVTPETRGMLQTNFFFSPLPFVERVVFIATPHRGSFLATSLVRRLARMFVSLPKNLLTVSADILRLREQTQLPEEIQRGVRTSLDGMSPQNKWLLELAGMSPTGGVKAHSIIAVKDSRNPPDSDDGVVKYPSAHVPYTESEFVVQSSHTCQDKPAVIEEVRRILLTHLAETRPPLKP